MERLDRAMVVPKDTTDLNQLTSLLDNHKWLEHVDERFAPHCAVGQSTYVFFNVDRLHKIWSMGTIGVDRCISVNELASQLAYWAGQPRYNP